MKKVTFIIFFLNSFMMFAQGLKVELLCPSKFKKLSVSDLCKKSKNCSWKIIKSSKKASHFEFQGKLSIRENPNAKGIKILADSNQKSLLKNIDLPWCDLLDVSLSDVALKETIKNNEVLYLLKENDQRHLPRLKAIKHPCRKLESLPLKGGVRQYYLKASPLKSCH